MIQIRKEVPELGLSFKDGKGVGFAKPRWYYGLADQPVDRLVKIYYVYPINYLVRLKNWLHRQFWFLVVMLMYRWFWLRGYSTREATGMIGDFFYSMYLKDEKKKKPLTRRGRKNKKRD